MKFYSGVGSRETPPEILEAMIDIATKLAYKDYCLRSGGADGADSAFEKGCDFAEGKKEIYLPWRGFNNNQSILYNTNTQAYDLAASIHPSWMFLSHGAKKLHARNICQVLGKDLNAPSEFIICWTKNGNKVGGTRTAIILAEQNKIPVYNLAISADYDKIQALIHG